MVDGVETEITTSDNSVIDPLAWFDPETVQISSAGSIESTLYSDDSLLEECLVVYDTSVYATPVSGGLFHGNNPATTKSPLTGGGIILNVDDYNPEGPFSVIPVGPTAEGSKVAPKQKVTLQIPIKDIDYIRFEGEAVNSFVCQRSTPANWPGNYFVKVELTKAKFTDGESVKIFSATPVDQKWYVQADVVVAETLSATDTVTVKITVDDKKKVPYSRAGYFTKTSCQDPSTSWIIHWQRGTVFPTNITNSVQNPGTLGTPIANNIAVTYTVGNDLNGADPAPNFEKVLIDEQFGTYTSNLSLTHLTNDARNEYAARGITTDEALRIDVLKLGHNTSFAIDNVDQFEDQFLGDNFYYIRDKLSTDGVNAEIWCNLPQWYLSNNARLNPTDYTIRQVKPAGDATGYTYQRIQ